MTGHRCLLPVLPVATLAIAAVVVLVGTSRPDGVAQSQANAPGRLVPNEYKHSFGEVWRGETVSTTFVLRNDGLGDVNLREIRCGCTCSAARIEIGGRQWSFDETQDAKQIGTLKPGETADLEVVLDTLDPGCACRDGLVTKRVSVFNDNPSMNPLVLTLEADLVTPYTVDPPRLDFGTVKQGETAKATCVVSSDRLGDFRIVKSTSVPDGIVTVTVAPLSREAPARAYRVEADLLPSASPGRYQTSVELRLDHPRVRAIVIPISAIVDPLPERH